MLFAFQMLLLRMLAIGWGANKYPIEKCAPSSPHNQRRENAGARTIASWTLAPEAVQCGSGGINTDAIDDLSFQD